MKRINLLSIVLLFLSINLTGQNTERLEGKWIIEEQLNGTVLSLKHIAHSLPKGWSFSMDLEEVDFEGFKKGNNVTFYVKKDAGVITYIGRVEERSGSGNFVFEANSEFIEEISKYGLEGMKVSDLMFFTLQEVKASLFKEFYDLGFRDDLKERATAIVALGITPGFAKRVQDAGFRGIKMNRLISFKALGITADYIKDLKEEYGSELSISDVTAIKAMNIDPAYVKQMNEAGFDLTPKQIVSFKAMNVTPEYLREIVDAGVKISEPKHILMLKTHGVDSRFIEECKKVGFTDLKPDALVKYKIFEITPEYRKMIMDAGYSDISAEHLTEFKIHKIDADFIMRAKEFNNGKLPEPSKLILMKISLNQPSE